MPLYTYKALDENGHKKEGEFSANSKNEVMAMIRQSKMYPIEVKESVRKKSFDINITKPKLKLKELAVFCRQFYTMVNAGSTMINALDILTNQAENKALKKALEEIRGDVQKGQELSSSMRNHENIFPNLLISMIEAGELSGTLDTVLLRMAEHFEKENKIYAKVRGAMVYPIVLGIASVGVVIFLLTFIMPTFITLFEDSGAELPGITLAVINLSNFIINNALFLTLLIVGIGFVVSIWAKSDTGKMSIEHIRLKLPVIGKTNNKIIISRFTRTLSTVLASGITLIEAIEVVGRVVGYKSVEKHLMIAKDKLMKGEDFSKAIQEMGIFPPMLVAMIKIGEESGSMDEILEKTANFYDDEVEEAIQKATALAEPMMILVTGVMIGFIVIAMMMPMFDMFAVVA